MNGKLILYTKGNRKQMEKLYGKDCTFVNTKRQCLKDIIQGTRYYSLCLHDLGVSMEDEKIANLYMVTKDKWNDYGKPVAGIFYKLEVN